jgi:NitT/TauT family transport system permease protein
MMMETLRRRGASIALIVGVFVFWEVACLLLGISDLILPRPTQIFDTLVEYGVVLGVLVGSSRLAYDTAYPLLVGFSSIPKVAVVPIFVLWFGAGTVPAVLTAMIICIFPIVVNVATGIATVEPELEDVMKTLKANKFDILWNVGLPRAMPYFFASLKVAITLAFVGSVVAETVASNRGVGNMMMIASSTFNVPLVFAGLMILAGLGVVLYAFFAVIESRVAGWAMRKNDMAMA